MRVCFVCQFSCVFTALSLHFSTFAPFHAVFLLLLPYSLLLLRHITALCHRCNAIMKWHTHTHRHEWKNLLPHTLTHSFMHKIRTPATSHTARNNIVSRFSPRVVQAFLSVYATPLNSLYIFTFFFFFLFVFFLFIAMQLLPLLSYSKGCGATTSWLQLLARQTEQRWTFEERTRVRSEIAGNGGHEEWHSLCGARRRHAFGHSL